jgi:hemolysin activation/secretion protein
MEVEKGRIEKCTISGEYFDDEAAKNLSSKLPGEKHSFVNIKRVIQALQKRDSDQLTEGFF